MVTFVKRDELFALAKKHKGDKAKIRADLIAYFQSPQGQQALRKAPRSTVEFEPNFPLQDQLVERIVDMILQELD